MKSVHTVQKERRGSRRRGRKTSTGRGCNCPGHKAVMAVMMSEYKHSTHTQSTHRHSTHTHGDTHTHTDASLIDTLRAKGLNGMHNERRQAKIASSFYNRN